MKAREIIEPLTGRFVNITWMGRIETSGFVPGDIETELLRAALWSGQDSVSSWRTWVSHTELWDLPRGCYHVIPLLYKNLESTGLDDEILAEYRSIYEHYTAISNEIIQCTARLTAALQEAGIPCMVLKGTASRYLYYDDPYTRTMADVDILITMADYHSVHRILTDAGFESERSLDRYGALIPIRHGATFRSAAGTKVDLHWHALQICCNDDADNLMWNNTRDLNTPEFNTITLNDTLQLLHTIVHATQRVKNKPIRWVCDATNITRNGDVDWHQFCAFGERLGVTPCLPDALEFLKLKMHIEVPEEVISDMRQAECSSTRLLELQSHSSPSGNFGMLKLLWHKYSYQQETKGEARHPLGYLAYIEQWCGVRSLPGLVRFMWKRKQEKRLETPKTGPLDVEGSEK